LLPIREVFIELGIIKDSPVPIYIDNLSAVHIAKNSGGQQRTKHIDVRQEWLSEQHESGKVSVEFVPGEEKLADMLTKPLNEGKFQANRNHPMATMALVAMLITMVNGFSFKPASPVFYEPIEFPYFRGLADVNFTFVELNPCRNWFANITKNSDWNKRLVHMCNSTFVEQTYDRLKLCRTPGENEVVSHRFQSRRGLRRRERRFVTIAMAYFHRIGALGSVYAVFKSEVNEANIRIMHQEMLNFRNITLQAKSALTAIRDTIHELTETD